MARRATVAIFVLGSLGVATGCFVVAARRDIGTWDGDFRRRVREFQAWRQGALLLERESGVLQRSWNDCGPAALATALGLSAADSRVEAIFRSIGKQKGGTTFEELAAASRRFGRPASLVWTSCSSAHLGHFPMIAYLKYRHFVVIRRKIDRDCFDVWDPWYGAMVLPAQVLSEYWSGAALIFQDTDAVSEPSLSPDETEQGGKNLPQPAEDVVF